MRSRGRIRVGPGVSGLLLTLILGSPPVVPEIAGTGRLKGSVTDGARRALVGARVWARAEVGEHDVLFATVTDNRGAWLLEGLPAAVWDVSAVADRHVPGVQRGVNVRPPFRPILDFRLVPGDDTIRIPPPPESEPIGAVPVTGRVTRGGEDAVVDAEVSFTGGPPPGRELALSRQSGEFEVPDVRPATYAFGVTAPGTLPVLIPEVAVRSGRPLEVRIRLIGMPVEMAVREDVVLPEEKPLPPLELFPLPSPVGGAPPPP